MPRPAPPSPPTARFVPPSPPASSAPSAWRRQHGQVEAPDISSVAFRPYFRAYPQLDRLADRGTITPEQWQAANMFRRLYEKAHQDELAAPGWDRIYLDPECRRRGSGEPSQQRLTAVERLGKVRSALGELAFALLTMTAVEDACWAEIGRRLKVDPKTARAWAIAAVQALTTAR